MATTTSVSELTINYLTQAQYDAEVAAGTINEDQIYMTPSSESGSGMPKFSLSGTTLTITTT